MSTEVKFYFEVLLVAVLVLQLTVAQNYCNPALCPNGKKHIACNNNGAFSSNCESNAKMMTITPQLQTAILNKHNQLRNKIASGNLPGYGAAVRMATMKWGSELAKIAAFNVKQCVMKHDNCRNTQNFPYSGQNLAVTSWFGKEMSVNEIAMQHIQMWFDEYNQASMSYINNYKNPPPDLKIGHFTQLVQERATTVGCAILRQDKGSTTYQFMACNYAFTNIFDRPVYRSGKAASKCTTGVNPYFKSLCSLKEVYNVKSTNY